MNGNEFKFASDQAVLYNGEMAKVVETALLVDGSKIYLIQTASHRYHYVYEEDLQIYIG